MVKRTQRSIRSIRTIINNVPSYISGEKSDRYGIGRVFWSTLANEFYSQLYESYEVRAAGGQDELGNSFAPLAKSTIASRPLKRGQSSLRADRESRDVLIMRVTDAIFKSLKPSKAGTNGYRKRKNQIYEQVGKTLKLGTTVKYAKFHNKTRPVIPENADEWASIATKRAFAAVAIHLSDNVI